MCRIGKLLSFSICLLLFRKSVCDFPTNFLGNYVSDDEYKNRTLCSTAVCLKDSGRLIYAADHDSIKTEPCDDFRKFAMGEFFEHRVPNDRYQSIGFRTDVDLQHWERQKRLLLEPIKDSDLKMFKVIKTYFRQCINTSETYNSIIKPHVFKFYVQITLKLKDQKTSSLYYDS